MSDSEIQEVCEKMVDQINNEVNNFISERGSRPKYLILAQGTRQAIKMIVHLEPFDPFQKIIKYLGIPVIPREEVLII